MEASDYQEETDENINQLHRIKKRDRESESRLE